MKGQLPPTSTPSWSILFSGSSQNRPKFSLLPHSRHTPLCHFKMGFAIWLRACGCARLSAQLSHQSTHVPSSNSIPPAWDCLSEAPPYGRLFVTPLGSVVSNRRLSCFFLQLRRIYFNIFSIPADAEASSFYFSLLKVIPLSQSSQSSNRSRSFWRPTENYHIFFLIWHAPPLCYILGWKWFMISSAHEKTSLLFSFLSVFLKKIFFLLKTRRDITEYVVFLVGVKRCLIRIHIISHIWNHFPLSVLDTLLNFH